MPHSSPPSSSIPQIRAKHDSYRAAKPLSVPLLDHCTTDLEEGLLSQGITLLSNALTSGTGSSAEAQIPLVEHLSFIATLIAHPQLTTRTTSTDKHAAADDALRYLRQVNGLVGPRNASLDKAFRFTEEVVSRSNRVKVRVSDPTALDDDVGVGRIRSAYADESSLWTKASDFWSIVGWTFNCSVAYPHRWERWKLLLDLILDVLEDDSEQLSPQAREVYKTGGTAAVRDFLKDSLFTQYLLPVGQGRNNKRRVMRAIFAAGTHKSLAEFGEIWKHETKPPKPDQHERLNKKRKLDLENDEFGDYLDESDQESPAGPTPRSRSATSLPNLQRSGAASETDDEDGEEPSGAKNPNGSFTAPGLEAFGGIEAIRLRQRFLALLTYYCAMNPEQFLDTEDLFDLFTEFLRPLPLPVFQQFVSPMKPYLGANSQASLNQMLLRPLLAATAPIYNENALTQSDFEAHYAPYAANSIGVVDNAKVSLLLESLLRLLWNGGALKRTAKLQSLIGQGIAIRKEKASWDGRKKVGSKLKVDEEAAVVLEYSAERMLMVLEMAPE